MTNKFRYIENEHATEISNHCPAHGQWRVKHMGDLSREAVAMVECPTCAKMPSTRALSIETVELTGYCEKHNRHWNRKVPKFGAQHMEGHCPDCDAERIARQDAEERSKHAGNLANKRNARIVELFERAAIPRRFRSRSFGNYLVESENDGQGEALARTKRYAKHFDKALERGASMILYGNPGTGKNHLAAAIANHIIPTFGASVMMLTVYELMQRIRALYQDRTKSEEELVKEIIGLDLLILDEVGVQLGTKHEEVILTSIIDGRYADMRPTLLLSNLDREQLTKQLGARVVDRMEEGGGGSIAFTWQSYRSQVIDDERLPRGKWQRPDWMGDDDSGAAVEPQ